MAESPPIKILMVGYSRTNITFLNRLIRGLAENNIQVVLATSDCRRSKLKAHDSIRCVWTPLRKGSWLSWPLHLFYLVFSTITSKRIRWLSSQINKTLRLRDKFGIFYRYAPFCHGDWDLIYFPWNSTAITYRGLFELDIPIVISCRGSQVNIRPHLPGHEAYLSGLRETLQMANAVHCVSTDIQQTVLGFGVDLAKCTVIRPAIDPDFFSPPAQPPHNSLFTLVTTGSLNWIKSYETMLAALQMLVDAGVDAQLHIIGEGPEHQHILFTIHDLRLQDRVTLHGRLAPSEVRDQLRAADVFVLSSLSEGIANAVLEAMSCGLPVVTTDCGGMREAVTDKVEGYVVPMRDPQAMAAALHKLAQDPKLRTRMGRAGRKRVLQDFCLDDQITAFIHLIDLIAETDFRHTS